MISHSKTSVLVLWMDLAAYVTLPFLSEAQTVQGSPLASLAAKARRMLELRVVRGMPVQKRGSRTMVLVTGDDENLNQVVLALTEQLATDDDIQVSGVGSKRKTKSTAEKLQASVDVGRPAQAVANWVQCEDPGCLKWRKLPWHVDVDLLPEAFCCKHDIWNPDACCCEAPEDEWDENEDPQLGSKDPQPKGVLGQKRKKIQSVPPSKKQKSTTKRCIKPLSPPGRMT